MGVRFGGTLNAPGDVMDLSRPVARPLIASLAVALAVSAAAAQSTTPRPAEGAPGRPAQDRQAPPEREAPPAVAPLRQAFAELDHADAAVRDAARLKLMGMRRRDLDSFRKLVQESLPLMP